MIKELKKLFDATDASLASTKQSKQMLFMFERDQALAAQKPSSSGGDQCRLQ